MGFNVSGLVINQNYENNFEDLQKKLGWNLKKEGEINFETASSNWKGEDICDVYFSEKGTLMFMSLEMCAQPWLLKEANTLTFVLSETSMIFSLNYAVNGVLVRTILEVEGNRMKETGEKLAIEKKSEDTSAIIWNQIEVVLGKSFWSIEPSEKADRYLFSKDMA
ncbi:MAG: hypothetical protein O9262_09240 [Cyclobacteriaceae bacterium]|nr:hypothetical protein [Cyclobacteriaceae bacterium]